MHFTSVNDSFYKCSIYKFGPFYRIVFTGQHARAVAVQLLRAEDGGGEAVLREPQERLQTVQGERRRSLGKETET